MIDKCQYQLSAPKCVQKQQICAVHSPHTHTDTHTQHAQAVVTFKAKQNGAGPLCNVEQVKSSQVAPESASHLNAMPIVILCRSL